MPADVVSISSLEFGIQEAMLSPGLVGGVTTAWYFGILLFLNCYIFSSSNNFNNSSRATILRGLLMELIVNFLFKDILLNKLYGGGV